jgi:Putative Ig domain
MPNLPGGNLYLSAPAVATIDQNGVLTVSFTPSVQYSLNGLAPAAGAVSSYSDYDHWHIVTSVNAGPSNTATFLAPVGYSGGSLTFTENVTSGTVTLTMAAFNSSPALITNFWNTSGVNIPSPGTVRTFPALLIPSNVVFSSTSVLLGQTLTVTLSSAYSGADQWQINWPDGTTTGWLPLASNVVTKSFSIPGTFNVTIQTRRNFSGSQFAPPTTLISQVIQQIFVVNQQATGTSSSQAGLTGNLGFGGPSGFEIVNANSGTATPEPWEVVARAMVRDGVTSELKLLIATSRFSNASSLFGTMALDVFPVEGRPRMKELIVPPYELTVTSQTETVPVKITTTAFPTLYVGKSVTQATGGTFALTAANGITPYIWSSVGLPEGLTINASGFLQGTPLELGVFSVTVAVQDSSIPFSIDEITLPLTVETDLKVQIAPGQTDANNTPLAQQGTTLGVAQVGTPYNVQMQVGNINPNATSAGGLAPYTWSTPAGAFPVGLSINPNTGLISGTPATYNSTTDFTTTFSVTVQVTDAIGAKATQVYTMTLKPQALQFGHVNQPTIYAFEQFKQVVPVFGGQSPYSSVAFFPATADAVSYGTVPIAPVDGQIEIPIGYTASQTSGFDTTGVRSFVLQVTDSSAPPNTLSQTLSFKVETQISDINIDNVPLVNWNHPSNGSWAANDPSEAGQAVNQPIAVAGNFNTAFAGGPAALIGGLRLNLTGVASSVGGNAAYAMPAYANFAALVNANVVISGFADSNANGTFQVQAATTATSLVVNNPNVLAPSAGPSYTLTLTNAATAVLVGGGTTVTVYAYSGASYGNGALNALVGLTFTVAGFLNASNNGSFVCVSSTATTITLLNSAGVLETHAGTAITPLAKALVLGVSSATQNGITLVGTVLNNGITVAIDPTNITVSGTPDVEFYGPAGPSTYVSGGTNFSFQNAEYRVPLVVDAVFQLTSVAAGTGIYSGTITGGSPNIYAGQNFAVSGFANAANNGTFPCTASTGTTLTLTNPSSVAETPATLPTPGQQAIATNLFSQTTTIMNGIGFGGQVSRDMTTLSHNSALLSTDVGIITTNVRPYIIGDVVGLNPRKPFFDSANIPSFTNTWTAQVQPGSSLPPGLSLDANTGLIYGTLTGTTSTTSIIQYIDGSGGGHGVITINWITLTNNFQLTDNVIDSQLVGNVYNGASSFTPPGGITLSGVSVQGVLPNGLTAVVNLVTNAIDITGTPLEAGYFDCWFSVTSTNGKTASVYHRISTITPVPILSIVGWADVLAGPTLGITQSFPLPNAVISASYVNPVTGNPIALVFENAVAPITLSSWINPTHGINLALGPGTQEPSGGIGLFSGTVLGGAGTIPVTITVSDSDPAHVSYTVNTSITIQATALTITTVPSPFPSVTAGVAYAPLITFTGHGSVLTPFTFTVSPVSVAQLPVGLTLTNATATTATIQGTTTQTGYGTKIVTIRCSDTSGAYVDVPYTVTVVAGLTVTSGLHYIDSASPASFLGLVDAGSVLNINVRPNLSFFLVATNVVSASPAGITVQTNNPNITGSVQSLASGVAQIELAGTGFNSTVSNTPYSVTVTVTDSGVTVSQTFQWTVYSDGTMALKASNATPTRLVQAT